ncbi:MAG TPA: ADP-ribosylglycohydrolase family protein [Candidatus Krumholzibacteria bacterium]
MTETTLLSRAQGALLGLLVGDALGGAVSGWEPGQIRDAFPDGLRDIVGSSERGTIAGQPGGRTEMALVLAHSLAGHGEYQAVASREGYLKWLQSSPPDHEERIRPALEGTPSPDDNDNAALVRVLPLGIFGSRVWPDVVELWAREEGEMTHSHPVCLAANELFAVAVATAIRVPSPREILFEHLRARAEQYDALLAETVRRARTDSPDYLSWPDSVLVATQNALWQLLHAESFEDALIDTVNRGGDASANAAVCGALIGAVCGRGVIPERWAKTVLSCQPGPGVARPRPREYWPVDALELAEKLVADHPAGVEMKR